MATGRAVVMYDWDRPWEIKEYPVPEPGPGAALIRITLASICGSDMHTWRGDSKGRPTPAAKHRGHEGIGHVAALGEGVTTDSGGAPVAVGDRVAFSTFFPCGQCKACIVGKDWHCPKRRDAQRESSDVWPHFRGTFGDYYYLFPNHTMYKVTDELTDDMLTGVNCAMCQVTSGWDVAGVNFGDNIVIQGAGGLGIYATAIAKERGAGKVIVIDGVQERLDLAVQFGADELIDMREMPTPEQRIQRVKDLTDGWGADAVMELVGYPQVVEEGLKMLGQGGRYVEIGCRSPGLSYAAVPEQWVSSNVVIYANNNWGRRHLRMALDMMYRTRDKYPYQNIISEKFPLEQVNEALAAQDKGHITRASLVP